jgi:hypothetical protein
MVLSSLTQKPESITSHGFCFLSRRRNRQWRSVWGNLWRHPVLVLASDCEVVTGGGGNKKKKRPLGSVHRTSDKRTRRSLLWTSLIRVGWPGPCYFAFAATRTGHGSVRMLINQSDRAPTMYGAETRNTREDGPVTLVGRKQPQAKSTEERNSARALTAR